MACLIEKSIYGQAFKCKVTYGEIRHNCRRPIVLAQGWNHPAEESSDHSHHLKPGSKIILTAVTKNLLLCLEFKFYLHCNWKRRTF
jgi:hypothetical protein